MMFSTSDARARSNARSQLCGFYVCLMISYVCLSIAILAQTTQATTTSSPATASTTLELNADLVIQEFNRFTDLSGQEEDVAIALELKNVGKTPITSFLFPIQASIASNLAFIESIVTPSLATVTATSFLRILKEPYENKLNIEKVSIPVEQSLSTSSSSPLTTSNFSFYSIQLRQPIRPSSSQTFLVFLSFTHTQIPFPATKLQMESQFVIYKDFLAIFSPYPINSINSKYKLASSKVESYTKRYASQRGDEVSYSVAPSQLPLKPFDAITLPVSLHFENNLPFVTVKTLRKEIEVSHWGNVAVTEFYEVVNTGATLTGPFSRLEYQQVQMRTQGASTTPATLDKLTATLPAYATDVYYRDRIGNVSTSHLRHSRKESVLEIEPRYPILGGWKTDFEIGLNLPATNHIFSQENSGYYLNISFGSMFPVAVVDEFELRIILPEGATDIKFITPFDIDSYDLSSHFTHLDVTGRPVLILRKTNVNRYHIQTIGVSYEFPLTSMLREPLIIFTAVFIFFSVAMLYYRLDLRISGDVSNLKHD